MGCSYINLIVEAVWISPDCWSTLVDALLIVNSIQSLYIRLSCRTKQTQKDTACTRLECYIHLYKLCLLNPARDGGPIPFLGKPAIALCRMAGTASQKRGTSSQILARTTHTNTHTPVIWICDLSQKKMRI